MFYRWPSEEGVQLFRTGNSNLTTWIGETKNPASHDESWRGHFFAWMLETGAQGVCEERRSPYLIRWVTNRIRCVFNNTVFKGAKNFQFVNFFTSRFPNKTPRQPTCKTDGELTIALWKVPAPPLKDLPSCGGTGGVNDPVQWQLKFSNPSRRNKNKPHQPKPVRFNCFEFN